MEKPRIIFKEALKKGLGAVNQNLSKLRLVVRNSMQKRWQHPEIRLSAASAPAGRLICHKPITERSLYASRQDLTWRLRPFTAFLIFSSISMVLMLCAMAMRAGSFSPLEQIADLRDGFFSSVVQKVSVAPEDTYGRTSPAIFEQDKEVAAQVLYISEMIEDHHDSDTARDLAISIVAESLRADVDPFFVTAIIKSESAFRKQARSHKGAIGLMQILPDTGRYISRQANVLWHGGTKLSDPRYNLKLGIAYIKYLSDQFDGNVEHALIAYNWGPANLNQALSRRSHIPSSTVKYARTILSDQRKFQRNFDTLKPRFAYMDTDFIVG